MEFVLAEDTGCAEKRGRGEEGGRRGGGGWGRGGGKGAMLRIRVKCIKTRRSGAKGKIGSFVGGENQCGRIAPPTDLLWRTGRAV